MSRENRPNQELHKYRPIQCPTSGCYEVFFYVHEDEATRIEKVICPHCSGPTFALFGYDKLNEQGSKGVRFWCDCCRKGFPMKGTLIRRFCTSCKERYDLFLYGMMGVPPVPPLKISACTDPTSASEPKTLNSVA